MSSPAPDRISGSGLAFAISSYFLWGFLPVIFYALRAASAVEIVAWRIVLSLVFCAVVLTVMRGWRRLLAVLRDRRSMLTLSLAAVLILINWLVYVYASGTGHVVEASLGYFTNPIVTVLLGVFLLRERLRPAQWLAVGISAIAVLVIAVGYGAFPWIALTLAASFGLYGLVKKRVASSVDAVSGLMVETAVLTPAATIALLAIGATAGLTVGREGPLHVALTMGLGIATATPLILFASATRRLPLVYVGLVQYLTPVMQLGIGVLILHEPMPTERWIGFGIVWLALAILTVDMFVHPGRQRRAAALGAP